MKVILLKYILNLMLQLKKTAKKRRYKMVIYQRDLSRKLLNQPEAVNNLQSTLGSAEWDIEVHFVVHLPYCCC